MEPLHTDALHPDRRAAFLSGQKIDGGPCANGHFRLNLRGVAGDPEFLLGRPQADNEQIGLSGVHTIDGRAVGFFLVFEPQGRAMGADHLDPGKLVMDGGGRTLGDTWPRTEQEDAEGLAGGARSVE